MRETISHDRDKTITETRLQYVETPRSARPNHRLRLIIRCSALVLVAFTAALCLSNHKAYAITVNGGGIPTSITGTNADDSNGTAAGQCDDNPTYSIAQIGWISPASNTASTTVPGAVAPGSTVNLSWNVADYYCNVFGSPSQATYYTHDLTEHTNYIVDGVTDSLNSKIASLKGATLEVTPNKDYRWAKNNDQFTYTAPSTPGTYTVTVSIAYQAINQFDTTNSADAFQCVGNTGTGYSRGSLTNFNGGTPCGTFTTELQFTLTVDNPTVPISGTVYSYDAATGTKTPLAGASVQLHDSNDGEDHDTTTNSNGIYTIDVPQGDTFSLNAEGGTYYIDPNGGGNYASNCSASPTDPPYCSAYTGYNFQTQGAASGSGTGHGVNNRGDNNGYDFVTPKAATVTSVAITGTLYSINPANGVETPVAGASVQLYDSNDQTDHNTTTASNGTYSITVPAGITFSINVEGGGKYYIDPQGGGNYSTTCHANPTAPPYCTGYSGYNFQTQGASSGSATGQGVNNRGVNTGYDFVIPSVAPTGKTATINGVVSSYTSNGDNSYLTALGTVDVEVIANGIPYYGTTANVDGNDTYNYDIKIPIGASFSVYVVSAGTYYIRTDTTSQALAGSPVPSATQYASDCPLVYEYGPYSPTDLPYCSNYSNFQHQTEGGAWAKTGYFGPTGTDPIYNRGTDYSYDFVYFPNGSIVNPTPTVQQPYMKVYDGDTMSGSGFMTENNNCAATATAGTYAWNNGTGNGYSGAGSTNAVFSYAADDGFVSDGGVSAAGSMIGKPSESLTFANGGAGYEDPSNYGGGFGYANCVPDYYTTLDDGAANVSTTASSSVTAYPTQNGDRNVFLYKKGNVYIGDGSEANIGLPGAVNLSSPNTMPYFYVVADGGNIYIDQNVTSLAGVFIAEPSSAGSTTTGQIYTCSDNTNQANPAINSSDLFTDCSKQLTVSGALIAKDVHFLRTNGTVGTASTPSNTASCSNPDAGAAEVICYSPMLWLASPFPAGTDAIKSISNLPPVL
jgi:hypothetical protein